MTAPSHSFTKIWHYDSYPAISATRPELSTKGKNVIITGGGTGIGAGIARGFATSGSTKIALLGRRKANLEETAKSLHQDFPGIEILTLSADVTKEESINAAFDEVFKTFGKIDICVGNAGYLETTKPAITADLEDYWLSFEINIKGLLLTARAFLRHAEEGSYLLNTSTAAIHMPSTIPGASAYSASKLAGAKVLEYISKENPGLHVVNIQPGSVESDMSRKAGIKGVDNMNLPSNFYVWLVSPEASFLNGKFVWSNWDVEELIARKDEIAKTDLLEIGLNGVSFMN